MTEPEQPSVAGEPLLPEPEAPADWECCGSECGDACIQEIYRKEKAAYDAQQKRLREAGLLPAKPVPPASE